MASRCPSWHNALMRAKPMDSTQAPLHHVAHASPEGRTERGRAGKKRSLLAKALATCGVVVAGLASACGSDSAPFGSDTPPPQPADAQVDAVDSSTRGEVSRDSSTEASPRREDGGDGGPTGPTRRCDPNKDFGAQTPLSTLASGFDEESFTMTGDELTAYFHRMTGAPSTIIQSSRTAKTEPFGAPTEAGLAIVNAGPGSKEWPAVTPDGLALFYVKDYGSTSPATGIYVAVRSTLGASLANEVRVPVVTPRPQGLYPPSALHLSSDGRTLYWYDRNDGVVYEAERNGPQSISPARVVATAMALSGFGNSNDRRNGFALSSDELTLYFPAQMPVLRWATRASKGDTFRYAGSNNNIYGWPRFLTADGCQLVLANPATSRGDTDLSVTSRPL